MKLQSICIFLAAIFCFSITDTFSGPIVPDENRWIRQSIELTINNKFAEAESLLVNRMAEGDSTIETKFYYASVLNSKMTHFENQDQENFYLKLLNRVIGQASSKLDSNVSLSAEQQARLYFYLGSAYGYLAYYQGQTGKWYAAINNGFEAVDNLRLAVDLDSTLYDAYLGIGVYSYWKSTKLKPILWLPFVPDSREEGIALIKKAIDNGAFGKYMAMHQLVYILLDYGDFEGALEYAKIIRQKYPKSQFMTWAWAHTYYKMHDFSKAIEAYNYLLGLVETDPQSNPEHWLAVQVQLADVFFKMKEYNSCIHHCQLAINGKYPEPISERGRDRIEKAQDLLELSLEELELLDSRK